MPNFYWVNTKMNRDTITFICTIVSTVASVISTLTTMRIVEHTREGIRQLQDRSLRTVVTITPEQAVQAGLKAPEAAEYVARTVRGLAV